MRQLSDERWAELSEAVMAEMGFAGDAAGRGRCRWVAIRHGTSAGDLTTRTWLSASWRRTAHGLACTTTARGRNAHAASWRLASACAISMPARARRAAAGSSRARGWPTRGEIATTAPTGASQSGDRGKRWSESCAAVRRPAGTRAISCRGCVSTVSRPRPVCQRRARGGRRLLGAPERSLAGQPADGVYGGGRLARDLTLPRLRARWPAGGGGLAAWPAVARAEPGGPARTADADPMVWSSQSAELGELRERLRGVPAGDLASWGHVAQETAGVFAAWSVRVEGEPGPLAATARALARSGELRAWQARGRLASLRSARGAALLLIAAAPGGSVAEAVMLRQLANLAKAVHDMHQAAGELQRAREIEAVVRGELAAFAEQLRATADPRPGAQASRRGPERREGSGRRVRARPHLHAVPVTRSRRARLEGQGPGSRTLSADLPAPLTGK